MPVDHYENFPVASLALPRRLRPDVVAIYGFARAADDIADEGEASPAERLARLATLERGLEAIAAGRPVAGAPLAALAQTVHRHQLPIEPLRALLDAFRQDVTTARYPTYSALLDYCRRSANPVGHLLLALYGAATPANVERADAICTALQLTNFWQDVAVDWGKGRVYLPQEDLHRFGVDEGSIASGRCDGAWRELMAFEVGRTRALFFRGRPLGRALPGRLGLELRLIVAGGERILQRIEGVGGDVFRHRPVLGRLDWLAMLARALAPAR